MGRVFDGMKKGFTETAKRDMRASNSVFARSMAASMDKREQQRLKEPAFEVPDEQFANGVQSHGDVDGQHAVQSAPKAKSGFGVGKKVLIVVGILIALSFVVPMLLTVLAAMM